ncbi:MAG: HIT family protein [Acidimicrobiia bacterium]|nr:HIT family protein [Acidimicrobiia bacterium]
MNDPRCTFCQIVLGERPAHVVLESPHALAFLDVRPLFPGHSLLVPRDHYQTLADLPAQLVGELFTDAQRLAVAVENAMEASGTFVAMNNRVSQSVPHFHVHVVPRRPKDGLRGFFWPRQSYDSEEAMTATAMAITAAVVARQAPGSESR